MSVCESGDWYCVALRESGGVGTPARYCGYSCEFSVFEFTAYDNPLPETCPHAEALRLAAAGTHILKAFPIGVAGFMQSDKAHVGGEE